MSLFFFFGFCLCATVPVWRSEGNFLWWFLLPPCGSQESNSGSWPWTCLLQPHLVTFSRPNSLFSKVAADSLPSPEQCMVPSFHLHISSLCNHSHRSGHVNALMSIRDYCDHLSMCYRCFVMVALSLCKTHGDLKTFQLRFC